MNSWLSLAVWLTGAPIMFGILWSHHDDRDTPIDIMLSALWPIVVLIWVGYRLGCAIFKGERP